MTIDSSPRIEGSHRSRSDFKSQTVERGRDWSFFEHSFLVIMFSPHLIFGRKRENRWKNSVICAQIIIPNYGSERMTEIGVRLTKLLQNFQCKLFKCRLTDSIVNL